MLRFLPQSLSKITLKTKYFKLACRILLKMVFKICFLKDEETILHGHFNVTVNYDF